MQEKYMLVCLELAKQALAAGDPPVGCVIVFEDTIIGRGIESGRSTGDVTNHAEILAIRDAVQQGHADKLPFSEMYTTHEPCVMCSYAIRHYKLPVIVYGVAVPVLGGCTSQFGLLVTEEIAKWGSKPVVIGGVCADEIKGLHL